MRLAARLFSTPTREGDHPPSRRDGPSGQHGGAPNDKAVCHLPCPPLGPSPSPFAVPLCLPVVRFFLRFALGERKKRPTGQTKEKTMEYHSNNNTNTDGSAAVHAASGSKNRKPATAQQLIRDNVQFLIEQLEAGHSESLTAFLDAMAHF